MGDYDELRAKLDERDVLNTEQNHHYNMEDPVVEKLYDKVEDRVEGQVTRAEKVSRTDITEAVDDSGDTLLVYEGDAKRFWGAVPDLEEDGFAYISTTPRRINPPVIEERSLLPFYESTKEAVGSLVPEMGRSLERVKEMGYDDMESFLADREDRGSRLAIGIETTEIPELYEDGEKEQIYDALKDEITEGTFEEVVFVKEGLDTKGAKRSLQRDNTAPWKAFLHHASQEGLDVGLAELSHGNYGEMPEKVLKEFKAKRMRERAEQMAAREQDQTYGS